MLENVGSVGQKKLLSSRVLIIGAGGLGSPAAVYLAAAGVGTIGLVDSDVLELSNLQRQIAHRTTDIGTQKVVSAKNTISALNPDVKVEMHEIRAKADNIAPVISRYDFIIDAVDNFESKFLINDACWFEKKPYCHGGIIRFDGQIMTIIPGQTACYRCIFDSSPPPDEAKQCSRDGVLGVLPGIIGTLQATEALKFLLGIGELVTDALLTYNSLKAQFRKIPLKRNPNCRLCGKTPQITELIGE